MLTNQIKNATAYVTAKGVYELWVNGYRVGPNILAPEWTDINARINYQTFDVSSYLTNGTVYSSNVIGGVTGEGWCYGPTDFDSGGGAYYGAPNPQFLLRLCVTNTDGTATNIVTDGTWVASTNGPIRSASIYAGEKDDATREGFTTNWATATYTPVSFTTPVVTNFGDISKFASQASDPMKIIEYRNPIKMWTNINELLQPVVIYDMGQNMVGWCNLLVLNTNGVYGYGSNIVVRHGETLILDSNNNGANGPSSTNIYRGNLQSASQIDTYILSGETNQQFHPHFTYHGFRFVEVSGPAAIRAQFDLNSITGCVIHSAVPIVGSFWCSDTNACSYVTNLVSKLVTNAFWGLRGNLQGVFTACTQRDEREGYFYDEHIFSQTACYFVDLGAFLTRWIRDIRDAQGRRHDLTADHNWGYTPCAPWDDNTVFVRGHINYNDPGVQAGGVIFPWRMYQNYADTRALAEHYNSLTNYVGFLTNSCNAGSGSWSVGFWTEGNNVQVGDWATGDFFEWFGQSFTRPYGWPLGSHYALAKSEAWGTAFCAQDLDTTASIATTLKQSALAAGDTSGASSYGNDFQYFTNLAARARTAYTNASSGLVSYTGGSISSIGWNSQSDHVMALNADMFAENRRPDVVQLLINGPHGITNYNSGYPYGISTNHLSGGYFGAPKAMLELTRAGYTKKAYELLIDTNFPCFLYSVINGFTTCWESWDTYLPGPKNTVFNGTSNNDRGYYPDTLTSFNHLPFGAVAEWIWKIIGGINPDDNNPGFKNVIVKAEPGGGITNAFASFNSIHGGTVTCWTNISATSNFVLNVTIPANTTASIFLPSTNLSNITEGGLAVTNASGVGSYYFTNWPNWSGGATVFQAGSGTYSFLVNGANF